MLFSRELLRGSLELMVMSELGRGPRYGYQVLSNLRARSGGKVELKAGTLYPLLHKLKRDGLVKAWWEKEGGRERRWYALTEKGRAQLAQVTREWLDYSSVVRGLLHPAIETT